MIIQYFPPPRGPPNVRSHSPNGFFFFFVTQFYSKIVLKSVPKHYPCARVPFYFFADVVNRRSAVGRTSGKRHVQKPRFAVQLARRRALTGKRYERVVRKKSHVSLVNAYALNGVSKTIFGATLYSVFSETVSSRRRAAVAAAAKIGLASKTSRSSPRPLTRESRWTRHSMSPDFRKSKRHEFRRGRKFFAKHSTGGCAKTRRL